MERFSILDDDGCLPERSRDQILKHTEVLECACPQHLLKVLKAINDFQEYETGCIIKHPKDAEIHAWLLEESKKAEKAVTSTLVELMKKEEIIDDTLSFCIPPKEVPGN